MIKAATDSPQRTRGGMSTSWMVALAIAFGITTIPATTQAAPPQPQERLCTGGFNTDYGWFFNAAELMSAIEVPGINSACINATGAGLKVQLGGLDLPLVEAMTYDYSSSPPRLQVPLLEPALCEDYTSAGSQSGALKLMLKDANGVQMFPSGSLIDSMAYSLSSGLLKPRGAGVSKIRCHSALSPNFVATPPAPIPGLIFRDGMEEDASNLQLEFLDAQGNPLGTDVLQQAVGGDVTFRVKVKNAGDKIAKNVRLREFVPISANLLMPTVSRVSCGVVDSGQGQGPTTCTGSTLPLDLSDIAPDDSLVFEVRRKSAGTNTTSGQSQALIQVAVFSDPTDGADAELRDNSRTLRIKVVNQTQVTRGIRTDGVAGGAGGSIAVGTALPSGCSTVGQVTTCPPSTSGLEFIATATSGYTFTGFTGCVGSSSNVTDTTGTFTTTTSASCTLTANFRSMPTVTASVSGSNGTISPSSQAIHYSEAAEFIVTPSAGYEVHEINGCGGVTYVSGQTSQTWTTGPITSGCAVTASFKAESYTVTVNVGANGVVTTTNPIVITYPTAQAVFLATPNANHTAEIASTSTCTTAGPLSFGQSVSFSAENVTEDCTIDLEFPLVTYPVTANPDVVNGKIWFLDAGNQVSDTDIDVPHGHTASFNLIPDPGFTFANPAYVTATGCTVDSVNYNTATQIWSAVTSAITANGCVISAIFTPE